MRSHRLKRSFYLKIELPRHRMPGSWPQAYRRMCVCAFQIPRPHYQQAYTRHLNYLQVLVADVAVPASPQHPNQPIRNSRANFGRSQTECQGVIFDLCCICTLGIYIWLAQGCSSQPFKQSSLTSSLHDMQDHSCLEDLSTFFSALAAKLLRTCQGTTCYHPITHSECLVLGAMLCRLDQGATLFVATASHRLHSLL